jgi:pyruvate dehydrogenase E2 component (dihydrolipoamide acetyltransferase)
MAIEITIPRLGWSMDEGTFGEWLKRDGETVAPGDALFSLESEKALQEVESVDAGILHILAGGPRDGDTVKVGMRIGWLLADGEAPPAAEAGSAAVAGLQPPSPATGPAQKPTVADRIGEQATGGPGRLRISPRAARVAAELGIDPSQISGSGRSGRIREADIRGAVGGRQAHPTNTPTLRRTIAERMLRSHLQTAPVTLTTRADAESLVAARRQAQADMGAAAPSYQDWIILAVAATLRDQPLLNLRWTDAGPVQPDGIHVGLAVDTPDGLVVPVIRDADRLDIRQIASASRQLVERARSRTCTADELTGGTFTVTNLGAFGIDAFTPIINFPETAVLGIGAVRREAVLRDDGAMDARHRITLSLTFDHRVTDGAPAARWLQTLVLRIEGLAATFATAIRCPGT